MSRKITPEKTPTRLPPNASSQASRVSLKIRGWNKPPNALPVKDAEKYRSNIASISAAVIPLVKNTQVEEGEQLVYPPLNPGFPESLSLSQTAQNAVRADIQLGKVFRDVLGFIPAFCPDRTGRRPCEPRGQFQQRGLSAAVEACQGNAFTLHEREGNAVEHLMGPEAL